ncbi:hypothetical protein NP493_4076g00002 [Ridgeia piscesae]|uniref:Uncharacterized protein n=1 Tax=Ridgeia piscesae TaxID=27915 RepID=A0AAD9J2L5_RIDPI|nr:hypothetical protein NP493_4076g00002 [Ridgeia piscesae]
MSTAAVPTEEDMTIEESSNSGSGTPLPSNPATPLPSNPATPLPSNPATPLTSNPGTPRSMDMLDAKSSIASNPGTPLSAETDSKSAWQAILPHPSLATQEPPDHKKQPPSQPVPQSRPSKLNQNMRALIWQPHI